MKKYFVIALCVVAIMMAIVSGVILTKNKEENHFALTPHQEIVIKKAKESGKRLTDAEIDTFTIGQGKQLFDQYLEKNHLQYKAGSQNYIDYLNKITIDESTIFDGPKFTIIGAYASVYMSDIQERMPSFFRFHLKQSTLNKTIKKIRIE